jgi:hypothetical protein
MAAREMADKVASRIGIGACPPALLRCEEGRPGRWLAILFMLSVAQNVMVLIRPNQRPCCDRAPR